MTTPKTRIDISFDQFGYNQEVATLMNLANQFMTLKKNLPQGLSEDNFIEYVKTPDLYESDYRAYADNSITFPITIDKKCELINLHWLEYKTSLNNLRQLMSTHLFFSSDIDFEGNLTTKCKSTLKDRFTQYVEGVAMAIYLKAKESEKALTELNTLMVDAGKFPLMNYSQFNARYFERLGSEIKFNYNNLLF
jgi:hypothetical protein